MKEFQIQHRYFGGEPKTFTEDTAPWWLKEGGVAGSTMDNRWFWNNHVMTLEVGSSVDTDFQTITRLK